MTATMMPRSAPAALRLCGRALTETDPAEVQASFVDAAVDAEEQVTAAIEHCINHHAEGSCGADPHACLDVALAVAAADAAVLLVAMWLIETGAYLRSRVDLAFESAQVLIAEAAALDADPEASTIKEVCQ